MVIQCARCKKVIGVKTPFNDPRVSHGLCIACYEQTIKELDEKYPSTPPPASS